RGRTIQHFAMVVIVITCCLTGGGCQQFELEQSVSPTDRADLGDALMFHIRSGWSVEAREASAHRIELAYLSEELFASDVIAVLANFVVPEKRLLPGGKVLMYYKWDDFDDWETVQEMLVN